MHRFTRDQAERERLEQAARSSPDKRAWLRMRTLLLWDEGRSAVEVARTFGISRDNLYRWRRRYLERRDPSDLLDRPKSGRRRSLDETERSELEDLLQKQPTEFGYHSHGWTVPLLLTHLRQQRSVEVSESTLRRTLRSLGYRWKRPRYVLARKDPEREEKKGSLAGASARSAEDYGGALRG
ncbi:MAG TPA: IS630 family transposase [Chloroflexota bacterium]|nr:IS630 family transposase [Chloroflexota bacterium]